VRLKIGDQEFVDAGEMGKLAGMKRGGVLRLARLGRVPYYEVGRRWLFSPAEFMQARSTRQN
jgi:hypothetical protein